MDLGPIYLDVSSDHLIDGVILRCVVATFLFSLPLVSLVAFFESFQRSLFSHETVYSFCSR